jgi:hypothetical protein
VLPRPGLPRRTAIALGVAGLVVATGCDDRSDPPVPPPSTTPDADAQLVDEVVAKITSVWRLTADRPGLAAVHEAHVAALDGTIEVAPLRRAVDLEVLRTREKRLQSSLVDAAAGARSGELARLLASMSAAIAQQVVVL